MSAPPVIADLVERFDQQGEAYKSGQYNEAPRCFRLSCFVHMGRNGARPSNFLSPASLIASSRN
jgi:hypothetical protein